MAGAIVRFPFGDVPDDDCPFTEFMPDAMWQGKLVLFTDGAYKK